jgi:hypothetical protein
MIDVMRPRVAWLPAVLGVSLATTVSCGGGGGGGGASGGIVPNLSAAVCDPAAGSFTDTVTNGFFPLPVDRELVLDGSEDGSPTHLVITVLGETEVVAGVTTRVVEERESADGELSEVSRNFFAQASDGTVCYFGEDVDIYEHGAITSHEGAWRAGVAGAIPGIIMPGAPAVGDAYQHEDAPGVAEDRAEITAIGDPVTVPAGTFDDTLTTVEDSAIEDGTGTKVYARGVGLLKDDTLELTSFH